MTMTKTAIRRSALGMLAWALLAPASAGIEMDSIRIAVFPFHTGEGAETRDAGNEAWHARRLSRRIDRLLARHGFEVVNPLAADPVAMEEVYGCLTTSWREGSLEDCLVRATQVMAETDVAYVVRLDVKTRGGGEGPCTTLVQLEVEGFDSGRRDFGVGVIGFADVFEVARTACEAALLAAEVKVADAVGQTLAGWRKHLLAVHREARARELATRAAPGAARAPTVYYSSARHRPPRNRSRLSPHVASRSRRTTRGRGATATTAAIASPVSTPIRSRWSPKSRCRPSRSTSIPRPTASCARR